MQIRGEINFNATPEEVWEVLLDPRVMAQCIPGCQELKEIEPDTYTAQLKVGVGAVSGTYQGKLSVTDKVELSGYSMAFEGSGKQGFVKGSGEAQLKGENGSTVLSYGCDVEVGGLIASVGQRVLEGVSQFLIKQMFTKLKSHVGQETPHEASRV